MTNRADLEEGVIYVATGEKFAAEAAQSLASLRRHEPDLPVTLFTDVSGEHSGFTAVVRIDDGRPERRKIFYPKVLHMGQSPYGRTLFLDTDTHVCGALRPVFALLDRFELAGAQAPIRLPKRLAGAPLLVPRQFVQMNSGVLLYRRSERVDTFLGDWLRRYETQSLPRYFADQEPLREALWFSDLQIGILSAEWNCRFGFGVSVSEPVKILHGRHACIELLERRINATPNGARTFRAADLTPAALRAWEQASGSRVVADR